MGMLRLFLPGNSKRQFHLDQDPTAPAPSETYKTQMSQMSIVKKKYSMMHYVKLFIRPKEFFAEFLGTFIMVLLVKSAAISLSTLVTRGDSAGHGAMLIGGLSAGLAVMVGILVTGNNSGAHMNPAVSVGMAVWGRIPVTSLPAYVIGQFMGSLAASGLLLSIWWNVIAEVGPEVMSSSPYLGTSESQLGVDQGVATFLMVMVACSLEDQGHSPPGLLMGLTVATVTITMGQNAGASMNPAADFMPRVVAAIYRQSWSPFEKGGKFWMIPFLVPYLGSVIAACVYSLFIERLQVTNHKCETISKTNNKYYEA